MAGKAGLRRDSKHRALRRGESIRANGKYQLNLWEANRLVFLESGISEEHISMPGICTCCNPDFLFSHRASKGKRGNLAAFLGVR